MSQNLLDMMKPLPENPVGLDVQYDEDFCSVKAEVEKLSDTNFEKVKMISIRLLVEKTKDLRVMGYLALSCAYLDDFKTLIFIFKVYEYWILHYWEIIYPKKEKSRKSAIIWLNDSRFIQLIQKKMNESDELEIKQLMDQVKSLNCALERLFIEESVQFLSLYKVLKEGLERRSLNTTVLTSYNVTEGQKKSEIYGVTSREEVDKLTREIIRFFEKGGQKIYAAAFARALRWSGLNPAVDVDNKTIFEPLLEVDKKELNSALNKDDPKELYQVCEKLFLNSGGHVNFDLQWHAFQAAKSMGDTQLALFLESEVKSLMSRIPKFFVLMYRDGTSFMGEKTKSWLKSPVDLNRENTQDFKTLLVRDKKKNKNGLWVNLLKGIRKSPIKTVILKLD